MARIDLDTATVLAKARFAETFDLSELSDLETSKLTVGCTPEASTITCTFYVPGKNPEDARILGVVTVDRKTGDASLVDDPAETELR